MTAEPRMPFDLRSAEDVSAHEVHDIVKEAYLYAYPFMLQYLTIRQATNFAGSTGIPSQGPFNQFSHARAFPTVEFKTVVRTNLDTLYSIANLDLGPEPIVLSVPATDRFFMMPIQSLWTDVFAAPGTRTTGRNTARNFLLVGPRCQGEAPRGLEIIRSPTRLATIAGRTQTNGAGDYESVYKIQQAYKLTPLSTWGERDYTPPKGKVDASIDMKTPPPVKLERMDAATFFGLFAELLKENPPGACDYPIIHRLERVGFKAGRSFNLSAALPEIRERFERAAADGKLLVTALGRKAGGEGEKGWVYTIRGGAYGVDYTYRAAVAYFGLGMNLPQDAVYPSMSADGQGRPLDGNRKYFLRFNKGKLPPVNAFWSVTAYDTDGYFIPNELKRQALGDRDILQFNPDGSLDLYIQSDSPGYDKETNWLPVAKAPFTLLMRLYSPKNDVLDGTWRPPELKREEAEARRAA